MHTQKTRRLILLALIVLVPLSARCAMEQKREAAKARPAPPIITPAPMPIPTMPYPRPAPPTPVGGWTPLVNGLILCSEIPVTVNEDGTVTVNFGKAVVQVYRRSDGLWKAVDRNGDEKPWTQKQIQVLYKLHRWPRGG